VRGQVLGPARADHVGCVPGGRLPGPDAVRKGGLRRTTCETF
jgi:hypothetical protein